MRFLISAIFMITFIVARGQTLDTEYKYTDSKSKNIIIQNSLPKGGIKYTVPTGKEFTYAVFWTLIKNETENPLELSISFPEESFRLPLSINNSVKLLLPPDIMTPEKESLFNYGLTNLETFLDENFNKKSNLNRIIAPGEAGLFYVTAIYEKSVDGLIRAGFSLKNNELIYKISGLEIPCGEIETLP